MRVVAESGSVDIAASILKEKFELPSEEEALQAAQVAAGNLIQTAPQPLATNFAYVCSYHNLSSISRAAMGRGDLNVALRAQTEIAKLLQAVQ